MKQNYAFSSAFLIHDWLCNKIPLQRLGKSTLPHFNNEWTISIRVLGLAKAGFQYQPLSLPYTNFTLLRWHNGRCQKIYIGKFVREVYESLCQDYCVYHFVSVTITLISPIRKPAWTLMFCLFVSLFGFERRPPGVNAAALSDSADPSTLELQPEMMDGCKPFHRCRSSMPKILGLSWFDSCVSNELLIGDGTGNALYDEDTKWCQPPANPHQ